MSLNFVSTSVLSSTDGVSHDKETNLDPNSSASANQTYQKPLYEQLRENAEKEQEKYDEQTRAMRAATTLNEEDAAFIQGVEERKEEIKRNAKRKEEEELQMFRAARLEKTVTTDDGISTSTKPTEKTLTSSKTDEVKITSSLLNMKPKILKKRRRKPEACDEGKETSDSSKKNKVYNETMDHKGDDNKKKTEIKNEKPSEVSALGGLLNYSDSDSD
ncbi:hypothetical protein CTEN210_15839 [Chaetoceros tenuissimus]|uniref:FAM192A/Fyv6 N-terminal domain-containing protein n=1 Tax=Chaetoceros tenuissimus TaxID=426638 RepID=A0AAD3D7S5_9STRA|nr:hypothetical protein CTEN210_15839 [Chaetoceros tenuissimus]